ncbi:major vault protein-like [Watersipora subatra]|uniref:major vault protein-like n=1 Tax=Watersipora subatra TaxID=2589382 RepID=UPI00355B1381
MSQERRGRGSGEESLYRIPPYFYIHVLDQNANTTTLQIGPKTYIRQDNERVVFGPERMITVPPRHYCVIENPVARDEDGAVIMENGQAKLLHADQEFRHAQEPFPLYPGEVIHTKVTPLRVVAANTALRLRALLDYESGAEKRTAGDEWLFEGPGTYMPRKEVSVEETVRATVIKANQAIKLGARKECVDRDGNERVTGEEWLVERIGAYLPGAYEEVIDVVSAYVLTEKDALHMRCLKTFTDSKKVTRRNGEEWLVKMSDSETYIPGVYEEVVGVVNITTLNSRQYCVILNPVDENGRPQLAKKKLVKGECSFFLVPGEKLEKGIQAIFVLGEDQGLILKANEKFVDGTTTRNPGDRWMIRGPAEYVPPVELEVLCERRAIPLDENEGIYVRDVKTGKVRAITGETYMLKSDEELWNKELSQSVEELLASGKDPLADRGSRGASAQSKSRDKTKVVTFRVPHNAAVQIYDYKDKRARVVFGPDLVMLGPDEQFTKLSLSGGKPKKPNAIKSLCLLLGPDFCTDIVIVETSDHARLSLQLSYNWHFEVADKEDPVAAAKLFSIPDFVGDACKAIASRVRGAVAGVPFDEFHKNSAKIIRSSVFGFDENRKVKSRFDFEQNSLVITSIDIQSVEPVDQRTRESLQKSVQLAIEITTNSQEAAAKHEAERLEQEAKGKLERQKISDEAEAEKSRRELLELQAHSAAVESSGQAKAEAQSRAEAAMIEGKAAVDQAKLKAEAVKIDAESELERLSNARSAENKYIAEQNELEVSKAERMSEIEVNKFKMMVSAIGADTLKAMANAGPEMQVRLLQGLGIRSTLITDGSSPINLFQTAQGLIAPPMPAAKRQKRQEYSESEDESN